MVIANPIYDSAFKLLMENEKAAKFFIGTLLGETIVNLEAKPQEYSYFSKLDNLTPEELKAFADKVRERLSILVYRLDFVATIKTEAGEHKKVLVEIQKAKSLVDVMRFRNYLGEQYKKEDTVDGSKVALPITTIYILGFNLPEIDTPCLKIERNYVDLINQRIITAKSEFAEALTHTCYVVQAGRITGRYQTRLDKLLSIFEQANFVEDKITVKEFYHETDMEEIKIITDILHHAGTNTEDRKKIEDEQEAWRTLGVYEEYAERYKRELDESKKEMEKKDRTLAEKEKALENSKKTIEDKDKLIEALRSQLGQTQKGDND